MNLIFFYTFLFINKKFFQLFYISHGKIYVYRAYIKEKKQL